MGNPDNGKVTIEEHNAWLEKFLNENSSMIEYLTDNMVDHPAPHSLIQHLIMQVKWEYPKVKAEVLSDILTDKILEARSFSYTNDAGFVSMFNQLLTSGFRPEIYKYKSDSENEHIINMFERNHSYDLAEYLTSLIYNKLKSEDNVKEWYDRNRANAVPLQAFDFSTIAYLRFAYNRKFWFGGTVYKAYINRNDYGYQNANILINGYDSRVFKAYISPKNFIKLSNGIMNLRFNNDDIVIHGKITKQRGTGEIILHADKFVSYRFDTIRRFS